jgi:hypothetical protein
VKAVCPSTVIEEVDCRDTTGKGLTADASCLYVVHLVPASVWLSPGRVSLLIRRVYMLKLRLLSMFGCRCGNFQGFNSTAGSSALKAGWTCSSFFFNKGAITQKTTPGVMCAFKANIEDQGFGR